MKKKLILVLAMLMLMSQSAFALSFPPVMQVNGSFVDAGEIVVYNNHIYVQARVLADVLGIITEWDDKTNTAYFYNGNKTVIVQNGIVSMMDNGNPLSSEVDTFISSEGRTFLPVRFFSEFFGYTSTWDANLQLISVSADGAVVPSAMILPAADMEDDLLWLARIISIEARGASMYKKVAIANVVLNRVKSDQFPNTVYGVVKQSGQFPPAYYSYFDTFEPPMHSYVSALHAFNGMNNVENCLYFNMVPHRWIPQSRYFGYIEGDYFYR